MKHLIKTIATIALVGIFSQAQAENGTLYNGSYCNAFQPTETTDFVRDHSGIKNTSNDELYISCPVLVDERANTAGTHTTWIHYTGGGEVECTLASMNQDGTIYQYRSGSRYGSGWFSLIRLTNDDPWGSYSMICSLPPGGKLNTIALRERND